MVKIVPTTDVDGIAPPLSKVIPFADFLAPPVLTPPGPVANITLESSQPDDDEGSMKLPQPYSSSPGDEVEELGAIPRKPKVAPNTTSTVASGTAKHLELAGNSVKDSVAPSKSGGKANTKEGADRKQPPRPHPLFAKRAHTTASTSTSASKAGPKARPKTVAITPQSSSTAGVCYLQFNSDYRSSRRTRRASHTAGG